MRDGIVKVRVNESEKAAIKAAADDAGLSVSDLLRRAAALPPERPAPHPNLAELVMLRRELNSVGVNLNQLVAAIHSKRVDGVPADKIKQLCVAVHGLGRRIQAEIER